MSRGQGVCRCARLRRRRNSTTGVYRCASHYAPSDPLTSAHRKTHPLTTNKVEGGEHQRSVDFGALLWVY
jgi:hypothetical protein